MSEMGLKFMGKNPSGVAEPITTDSNGNQIVLMRGSENKTHSHTYSGQTAHNSSYYYGENKTLSTSGGHRPFDVSIYDKIMIIYKNNTDKPRRIRLFLTYSNESVGGSVTPEVGLNSVRIRPAIDIARVEPGGTFSFIPTTLDVINGYKELDFPVIGLTLNTTYWSNGGTSQEVNGSEEVIILGR